MESGIMTNIKSLIPFDHKFQ